MIRLSERLVGRSFWLCRAFVLTAAASATILLPAAPSGAASPSDRRATGEYLRAKYRFYQALHANDAAGEAAVSAYIAKLADECPGVLTNAPYNVFDLAHPTYEQSQQIEQETALGLEALAGILDAWFSPDDPDVAALGSAILPLRWHDRRVARLVRVELAAIERLVLAVPPDVCADMRAWASSGYRTLPPGAREPFATSEEGATAQSLVASLVGPQQRALAKRTKHAIVRFDGDARRVISRLKDALVALGVKRSVTVKLAEPSSRTRGRQ